jgi:hypothetical protein
VKAVQLIIESTDIDPLIEIIKDEIIVDYQSSSKDTIVFISERFNFRSISYKSEIVILSKEEDKIIIEIIGSGEGTGLINMFWNSSTSFVRKLANDLITYCDKNNIPGKKTEKL